MIEVGAVFRLVGHLRRERCQHALHDGARLRALLGRAADQQVAELAEEAGKRTHAPEPGLVVLHGLEWHHVGHFIE